MTTLLPALGATLALLVLIVLRVPVGIAMASVAQ